MEKPNADIVLGFFTGALLVSFGAAALSAPANAAPWMEPRRCEVLMPAAGMQELFGNGRRCNRHGSGHN